MANRTYLSSFDSKNAETAHVDDSSANTTVTPLYVVWDRSTRTVDGVHLTVAAAQLQVAGLLAGPGYVKRLAIATVPL